MSQRTRGGRFTLHVVLGHAFLWDQVGVLDRPDDDSKLIGVVTRSKRTTVLVVVVAAATAAGKRTQDRKTLVLWTHVANNKDFTKEGMATAASALIQSQAERNSLEVFDRWRL